MTSVTLADFVAFIRAQRIIVNINGVVTTITISDSDLPDDSTDIQNAYDVTLARVATLLDSMYKTAFLNLAMHLLICYSNAEIFDNVKIAYKVDSLRTGVIGSASDNGTSASWQAIPNFLTQLNGWENWLMTTPYGRNYFNIASQFSALIGWV